MAKDTISKKATVRVIDIGDRQGLEVVVPKGTTAKGTLKVIESLDSIIERLTGCPCLSGLDIRFRDRLPLEEVAQIELGR